MVDSVAHPCLSKLVPFSPFSRRIPWLPNGRPVLGGPAATTAARTGPVEYAVCRGGFCSEHRGRLEGVPRIKSRRVATLPCSEGYIVPYRAPSSPASPSR